LGEDSATEFRVMRAQWTTKCPAGSKRLNLLCVCKGVYAFPALGQCWYAPLNFVNRQLVRTDIIEMLVVQLTEYVVS
jgi:hypothetical protein